MHEQLTIFDSSKRCAGCGHLKALAEFHLAGDGQRRARCKVCVNERWRELYYAGPATAVESRKHRRWWAENTEVPYGFCWCGCGERTPISRETDSRFSARKGCPRQYVNRGHAGRIDPHTSAHCEWCGELKAPSEFYVNKRGIRRRGNTCKACYMAAQRVRRLRGATLRQWLAMVEWYGGACLCCGVVAPMTIDHVVPVSRGGAGDIANLQPLCFSCNSRKHAKTVDYRDPERLAAFMASLKKRGLI